MPTFSSLFRPALLLAFTAFLASCERSGDVQPAPATGSGTNVYITNEGAFGSSNGSVTLFDKTARRLRPPIFFRPPTPGRWATWWSR